jgi:hypothetical protein
MNISKSLLEKIIQLRDLRQAISAVRKNSAIKKADDPPSTKWPKPDLSDKAKARQPGHPARSVSIEAPEVGDKKAYGLKHLGVKRTYGGVVHMVGVPGSNRHYEIHVNRSSPKIEHTIRLVTSDGSTLNRSPNVHGDIKSAVEDVAHHFNKREWLRR